MTQLILIAEDDPVQCRLLDAAVSKAGYSSLLANDGREVFEAFDGPRGRDIALLVLDLGLPDMDGLAVMEKMRSSGIDVPVLVQTAQGSIETVINAMRAGAFDYVVKPVSPERLKSSIANALRVEQAESETKKHRPAPSGVLDFDDIVSTSPAMERVISLGRKAAATNIPVLIEGESGVGKELVARAIQGSGGRRKKPFVTVNCGAIPSNLVESILFGHEKGSFTGATEKHTGKFVEADSGTLFLDEIGDLPLDVQVKLLRAIQDGEVDPVGAKRSRKVDIRLISATHRDLIQRVKDGHFREDLFYRLNVFPITVPPLRDRRDDIPALVKHFMAQNPAGGAGERITGISAETLAMLKAYDWPGNIRQLENAVLRAVVLSDDETLGLDEFPQIRAQVEGIDLSAAARPAQTAAPDIEPEKAPMRGTGEEEVFRFDADEEEVFRFDADEAEKPSGPAGTDGLSVLDERGDVRALSDVEYDMICFAIDHYAGQMSEVARRLGIGRSTLYRKLKEYGIDPEDMRGDKLAS
ncbi:MAG: sigma-54-dependent transcriptional regulator [Rhizobiaceae bacterium]